MKQHQSIVQKYIEIEIAENEMFYDLSKIPEIEDNKSHKIDWNDISLEFNKQSTKKLTAKECQTIWKYYVYRKENNEGVSDDELDTTTKKNERILNK